MPVPDDTILAASAASAASADPPPPRARGARSQRRSRWWTALGCTVLALLVAELAVRILGVTHAARSFRFLGDILSEPESYVADPELFWKLRPNPPTTNRLGLRGYLPQRDAKPAGTVRIACVGDSCTYGAHVRYEESYGMVLERLLRDAMPHRRVETILAGVPGYSTHQNRIVFERDVAPLHPDVTILYCGGWNDYVPAFGRSDRDRAGGPLRLVGLVRDAVLGTGVSDADKQRYWSEFRAGRAPDGRRVPLQQFRDNLQAMIDAARSVGSTIVVVVPPIDEVTFEATPIAGRYRRALLDVAAAHGLPSLDAPALFRAARERIPAAVRQLYPAEWPAQIDWVHPSPLGHRLIAEGLFEILAARGFAELAGDPAPGAERDRAPAAPRVTAVRPVAVDAGATVEIAGAGFGSTAALDRVFAGPWWLPDCTVAGDTAIRAAVPFGTRPGDYPLVLVGGFGTVTTDAGLRVRAPSLDVSVEPADGDGAGGGLRVTIVCAGPPQWRAGVWVAETLRPTPVDTRYGGFELALDPPGWPLGIDGIPFPFERLPFLVSGETDASGTWRHETTLDRALVETLPDLAHFQGLMVETRVTGRATLTRRTSVRVR